MPYPPITPLPTPPSRSQSPATFSADADAFLGALPDFQSDANALGSYLDGVAAAVDADAATAAAAALDAEAAASIAAGVADYQGVYNAGTTYQIGQSVSYSGSLFVANTVNTGITPVNGANWFEIANGDVTLNGVQTLTNKTIAFGSNTLTGVAPTANPTFTGTVTTATADLLGSVRGNVTAVAASAIDCSAGNYFTKTATGALTWTVTNAPASRSFAFALQLTNGGSGTQTWPAAVVWNGGTAPTLQTSGTDILVFVTPDSGTTWRGVRAWKQA